MPARGRPRLDEAAPRLLGPRLLMLGLVAPGAGRRAVLALVAPRPRPGHLQAPISTPEGTACEAGV